MEVHHHPHIDSDSHRNKRFKEYFLEFLMIFLAVTLGFIAENIRESFVNKEKERHYIQNISSDLHNDIIQLDTTIAIQILWHHHLDSALNMPIESLTEVSKQDSFLYHFFPFYSLVPTFNQNDNTINQLRSGGFNVFRSEATIDSISKVYNNLVKYNIDFWLSTYWDAAHQAQAIMRLPPPAISTADPNLFKLRENYPVFSRFDKVQTIQLYNKIGNADGTLVTLIGNEQSYRESIVTLLKFLNSRYSSY
jgi:hypothetical protein